MADRRDLRQCVIALTEKVFHLRRQVECATSHWEQRRDGLINFKIMGSFKGVILQDSRVVRQGKRTKPFAEFMKRTRSAPNQIRAAANFPGTSRTVVKHLRNANIHNRRTASKEGLTEGQVDDRLAFATGWRDFDWGSVIFIDKTSISSDCESRGHVYPEPRTRYDTRYIQRRERSGWFSVSCWGWISRSGVGVLERVHGKFNAPHILENVMLPSVRVWNPEGNLIFQQDKHPVHCSMSVQIWLARGAQIDLMR